MRRRQLAKSGHDAVPRPDQAKGRTRPSAFSGFAFSRSIAWVRHQVLGDGALGDGAQGRSNIYMFSSKFLLLRFRLNIMRIPSSRLNRLSKFRDHIFLFWFLGKLFRLSLSSHPPGGVPMRFL